MSTLESPTRCTSLDWEYIAARVGCYPFCERLLVEPAEVLPAMREARDRGLEVVWDYLFGGWYVLPQEDA